MRLSARALKAIAIVCWVNFAVFLAVNVSIGGDALNGKTAGGHYYLNNHGRYTEVSHAVFVYSACHASAAILGMIFFVIIARKLKTKA